MRRLLLAALSMAIVAVAVAACGSGTHARAGSDATVRQAVGNRVLRPPAPGARVLPQPGPTVCYAAASTCTERPCVEFVGHPAPLASPVPVALPGTLGAQLQALGRQLARSGSLRRLPEPRVLPAVSPGSRCRPVVGPQRVVVGVKLGSPVSAPVALRAVGGATVDR